MNHIPLPMLDLNDLYRFWSKVSGYGTDGCWEWLAGKFTLGYGTFTIKNRTFLATRVSYYLNYKVDPGELNVCHECNNPSYVNPDHLFLGTQSVNIKHAFECQRANVSGSANPAAILNEGVVAIIKQRLINGESDSRLAVEFGMSQPTINNIKHGKSWRHVTIKQGV